MQRAQADLFGHVAPSFDHDALGFLLDFAASRGGQSFGAEDVVRAANDAGLMPRDLRNWGPVFAQAARAGHIARDYSHTFRRATSNGSLGVGWKSITNECPRKCQA